MPADLVLGDGQVSAVLDLKQVSDQVVVLFLDVPELLHLVELERLGLRAHDDSLLLLVLRVEGLQAVGRRLLLCEGAMLDVVYGLPMPLFLVVSVDLGREVSLLEEGRSVHLFYKWVY